MGDYKGAEQVYDDNDCDEIINSTAVSIAKYKWRVVLEIPQHVQTVEADTAEEAMRIAETNFQLKEFGIDRLPPMVCTEAQISGVTPKYGAIMTGYKEANEPPF